MLKPTRSYYLLFLLSSLWLGCISREKQDDTKVMKESVNASYILGNPDFPAICYGGYRETSREMEPSITQLKEDMKLLSALGIKLLRTYNTHFKEARNLLQAIRELKEENAQFEMYVMLGAWIDCENAWTEFPPNHEAENEKANSAEIQRAVELANAFPETVKIIAVGNESMVRWAESYYVQPKVILRWVKHLQDLKRSGKLDQNLWITSSDNFASWGGDSSYHCADLEELIRAVDYVSLHTYPMHDTHYNPNFWGVLEPEMHLPKTHMIRRVMKRALVYAQGQYYRTSKYIHSIDSTKPVHIGETGWASESTGHYGLDGSMACDEYKQGLYYHLIRNWTNKEGISCFFFEAFNEQWKDAQDPKGSENHFGLFTLTGEAKYALWDLVDQKQFEGLYRDGHPVRKTYAGNLDSLLKEVAFPPVKQLR